MRSAMGRMRIVTGDEQDCYTGWRKLYIYTQRAGVVKSVKRRTHKRMRREGQRETREQ